jgi:hypothetical protein
MAVVIGIPIQYYDTFFCSPEHQVFVVILRVFQVMADKAITFFVQPLYVVDSPGRP